MSLSPADHLVIGASGQVGQQLLADLRKRSLTVQGTYFKSRRVDLLQLNMQIADEVTVLMRLCRPRVVYLAAGMDNVEFCEQQPEESFKTNVDGVCNVIRAASAIGAKIVFFSSDYIFDGTGGPYVEGARARPICQYGWQQLLSEHYLALWATKYLIVRTTLVYGWEPQRKNFVCRLVDTLSRGESLKVPIDQVGNPTYAANLSAAVIELALSEHHGVFNICGPERVSRFNFAMAAAQTFGLDASLLVPVLTAELGQVARRPLNAGMVVDKIYTAVNKDLLSYRAGLAAMHSL